MDKERIKQVEEVISKLSDTYIEIVNHVFEAYLIEESERKKNNVGKLGFTEHFLYGILRCAIPHTIFTYDRAIKKIIVNEHPEELQTYLEKYIYDLIGTPVMAMK